MMNNKSYNPNAKKCGHCGSQKTDIVNEDGTLVFKWLRDPNRKGTWICGNCKREGMDHAARIVARIRDRILKKERERD
jgi:hypothetical protein